MSDDHRGKERLQAEFSERESSGRGQPPGWLATLFSAVLPARGSYGGRTELEEFQTRGARSKVTAGRAASITGIATFLLAVGCASIPREREELPPILVRGVVFTDEGPASGGHVVCAQNFFTIDGAFSHDEVERALVHEDGRFELTIHGETFRLVACVAGYAPISSGELTRSSALDPVQLHVEHGRLARGRVVDTTGEPISGVRVSWQIDCSGIEDLNLPGVSATRLSAEDGTFELTGIPFRSVVLQLAHPECLPSSTPVEPYAIDPERSPAGAASEPRAISDVTVTRGVWLTGIVPAEVPASSIPISPGPGRRFYQDPDAPRSDLGTPVRTSVLTPETCSAEVGFPGTTTARVKWTATTGCVDLGILEIGLGSQLEVRILDENARPVRGAIVRTPRSMGQAVVTDADGFARITGLESSASVVRIEHPEFPDFDRAIDLDGPLTQVEFELQRGCRIRGRVGAEGPPTTLLATGSDQAQYFSKPNRDGVFEVCVRPGLVRLEVFREDHRPAVFTRLSAEAGEVIDLGRIDFEPGITIEGRVTDERGIPLPDIRFQQVFEGDPSLDPYRLGTREVWADEHGRFRVGGLASGRYRYTPLSSTLKPDPVFVDFRESGRLTLEFDRGHQFRCRLVDTSGEPWGNLSRERSNLQFGSTIRVSGYQRLPNGYRRFVGRMVGSSLELSGLEESPVALDLEVLPGTIRRRYRVLQPDQLPEAVTLPRFSTVTLEFEEAIDGSYAYLVSSSGRVFSFEPEFFDGSSPNLVLLWVEPGEYELYVSALDRSCVRRRLTVDDGEDVRVEVQLEELSEADARDFVVHVSGPDGKPAAGAWVQLFSVRDGGPQASGKCDRDGRVGLRCHPEKVGWLEVGGPTLSRVLHEDPIGTARDGVIRVEAPGRAQLHVRLREGQTFRDRAERVWLQPIHVAGSDPSSIWLFASNGVHARSDVPSGEYHLWVLAGDSTRCAVVVSREIRVVAGEDQELIVDLPEHTPVAATVRVADQPVSGKLLLVILVEDRPYYVTADVESGRANFTVAHAGTGRVLFTDSEGRTRSAALSLDGPTLQLEFEE